MSGMKALFTEQQELGDASRFREPDNPCEEYPEVPPEILGWETDDGWTWDDIAPETPDNEFYFDRCRICGKETPHTDFNTPTSDNPYEITPACLVCVKVSEHQDETLMSEWREEYDRLQAEGCGDAAETAWERINEF